MIKSSLIVKRVLYWVKMLDLRMWHIKVYFKEPEEIQESLRSPGNVACIFHKDCVYEADMWLTSLYLNEEEITEDLDNSIVHELLHLVLTDAFDNARTMGWVKTVHTERAINMIAKAIVKLERRKHN